MFIVASGLHFGTNNCFYYFLMDRWMYGAQYCKIIFLNGTY